MTNLDKRQTEAFERIAKALEFFVGIHPSYRPEPNEPPLPSSPQARAYEEAQLKKAAEIELNQLKAVAAEAQRKAEAAEAERVGAEKEVELARKAAVSADKELADAENNHAPEPVMVKAKANQRAAAANVTVAEKALVDKAGAEQSAKMAADHAQHAVDLKSAPPKPAENPKPAEKPKEDSRGEK